jgi:hypothetical protein
MHSTWAAVALTSVLALSACRHSYNDRVEQLRSLDPDERRVAADELRAAGGPAPTAVPYLFEAISHERNPATYGAMLITLGASGAPEARPLIEARLRDPDSAMRRWAGTAMDYWSARNGVRPPRKSGGVHIVILPPKRHHHPTAPPPDEPPEQVSQQAASDGCDQFAQACASDPFDRDRCKRELGTWRPAALESWATCINGSADPCQKTYDDCVAKFAER